MELARSIVSRLRQYVGERRHAERKRVRLTCTVSMVSSAKRIDGIKRINSVEGHTVDLSPNGLALVVPAIRLGEQHLVGEHRSLNLSLKLPTGPVEMKVTPIRYESIEEGQSESGYLIGVSITEMREEDRLTFTAYVSTLLERRL